jgi:cytoskeletal protein RodZ
MSEKQKEIGRILAAARQDQGKSLTEAAESTKIMENYLKAVEAGESDGLPSTAYFDLFARSYAQYLGLDPALFEEITDHEPAKVAAGDEGAEIEAGEPVESVSQVQTKRFVRSLIYLASAIVIVFIGFIVYSQFFMKEDDSPFQPSSAETATDMESMPDDGESEELVIPVEAYTPPGKLRLHLKTRQDVWAIVERDGDTVLNRRLVVGDERWWEADYRYSLTLGISTAVDLFVNDQKLAPLTEQAQTVSGFEINQVNYRDLLLEEQAAEAETEARPLETAPTTTETTPSPPPAESNTPPANEGATDGT